MIKEKKVENTSEVQKIENWIVRLSLIIAVICGAIGNVLFRFLGLVLFSALSSAIFGASLYGLSAIWKDKPHYKTKMIFSMILVFIIVISIFFFGGAFINETIYLPEQIPLAQAASPVLGNVSLS